MYCIVNVTNIFYVSNESVGESNRHITHRFATYTPSSKWLHSNRHRQTDWYTHAECDVLVFRRLLYEEDGDTLFHNQVVILLHNEIKNPIRSHKRMAVMWHCGRTSNESSIGGPLYQKKLLWRRLGWSGIKRSQTDSHVHGVFFDTLFDWISPLISFFAVHSIGWKERLGHSMWTKVLNVNIETRQSKKSPISKNPT